jgi:hypothetical protein
VFVLDPFPNADTAGTARACEVRCRDVRLVDEVLARSVVGTPVAVSGELTMSRAGDPVEDELSAVLVAIEAEAVQFSARAEPSA